MNQDQKKRAAGDAALQFINDGAIIGVGTGSTVKHFIDALKTLKFQIKAAVSSSSGTSALLRAARIDELDLNSAGDLDIYVDGADEATRQGMLIKGGGGALLREKVIAAASKRFVCLIDDGKVVPTLGRFPLPVEVVPMARSYVARRLLGMGGQPVWRENVVTDNGNQILDVHNLKIVDPITLEESINAIAGVVCVGLFARRGADVLLVASDAGVETIRP